MDVSNLINLGLLLLAGLGVIVAARQAGNAKTDRDAAAASTAEAARHAAASLAASERSAQASERATLEYARIADAAERQAAIAETAHVIPDPWRFEALSDTSSDQTWRVTNVAGQNVTSVSVGTPAGFDEQWIEAADEAVDLAAGESLEFTFRRRLSSPSSAVVWILWTPADGSPQKKFVKTI